MKSRPITVAFVTGLSLLIAGLFLGGYLARSRTRIGIAFVGFTNNSAGLLAAADPTLAVFSVTNGSSTPIEAEGFYYIERPGSLTTYGPLGSDGQILPHDCGTILTRIPTNGAPWRVIVPYYQATPASKIVRGAHDSLDRALNLPLFDTRRYLPGAPRSDWVAP